MTTLISEFIRKMLVTIAFLSAVFVCAPAIASPIRPDVIEVESLDVAGILHRRGELNVAIDASRRHETGDDELTMSMIRLGYAYDVLLDNIRAEEALDRDDAQEDDGDVLHGKGRKRAPPFDFRFYIEGLNAYQEMRFELENDLVHMRGAQARENDIRRARAAAAEAYRKLGPDASELDRAISALALENESARLRSVASEIRFARKRNELDRLESIHLAQDLDYIRRHIKVEVEARENFDIDGAGELYRIVDMRAPLRKELELAEDELARLLRPGSAPGDSSKILSLRMEFAREKIEIIEAITSLLGRGSVMLEEIRDLRFEHYRLLTGQFGSLEILRRRWVARNNYDATQLYLSYQVKQRGRAADRLQVLKEALARQYDPDIAALYGEEVVFYERYAGVYGDFMRILSRYEDAYGDYLFDLEGGNALMRYTRAALAFAREQGIALWATKVWSDGEGRFATVGELVEALFMLTIALSLVWFLQKRMRRLMLKRFRVEPTLALTINRLIFAAFCILALLAAMSALDIPIAAFAFMGGTVAVAVGLGARDIVYNVISGFMLMISRTIRIGETLVLDGVVVTVRDIGLSRTLVINADGEEILVPNGVLVSERLVSRSHSNHQFRIGIDFYAPYDSDIKLITRLIRSAADENEAVLKSPPAAVYFLNFSAYLIKFKLAAWIDVSIYDSAAVASDLRYRIGELMAENGVRSPQSNPSSESIKSGDQL